MKDISKILIGVVTVIVLIVVILQIVGTTAPDLQGAANNMTYTSNGSVSTPRTLPLVSLFGASGPVMIIFMAFLLVGIIALLTIGFIKKGKR